MAYRTSDSNKSSHFSTGLVLKILHMISKLLHLKEGIPNNFPFAWNQVKLDISLKCRALILNTAAVRRNGGILLLVVTFRLGTVLKSLIKR
jgi:hypothetical protein